MPASSLNHTLMVPSYGACQRISSTNLKCIFFAREKIWLQLFSTRAFTLTQNYATPNPSPHDTNSTSKVAPRDSARRFNSVGIEQISSHLHTQIFPNLKPDINENLASLARKHLNRQNLLHLTPSIKTNQNVISFDLPPLLGPTLSAHFYKISLSAASPYLQNCLDFVAQKAELKPQKWLIQSGWTKYEYHGEHISVHRVNHPDTNDKVIVFDTEVLYNISPYAVFAIAASNKAWYVWLSPWLMGESESMVHLIPLGSDPNHPRVIIGHHSGYDRARVLEEYDINSNGNFFIDTMSLHVAVNGMCSRQRSVWLKHRKACDLRDRVIDDTRDEERADLAGLIQSTVFLLDANERWLDRSSINSLDDVARFHCGIKVNKKLRDDFGKMDRETLLAQINNYLDYCATDVEVARKVFGKVFPIFRHTCPHPASFAALRHLASEILPVNKTWEIYVKNAEETYCKLEDAVRHRLLSLAKDAVELRNKPDMYKNDPWLRQLDWSGQQIRYVKAKKKGDKPKLAARQKAPGMPQWWKDLIPSCKHDTPCITVRSRIAPLLLRLTWDSYPLVWSDKFGFVYRVPLDVMMSESWKRRLNGADLIPCDKSMDDNPIIKYDDDHEYFKLPHKDGSLARCVNPLAKGYLDHFEKGRLNSELPYAKEALEMNASCSYWISARERIMRQLVVYKSQLSKLRDDTGVSKLSNKVRDSGDLDAESGFIIPQIIPMGTVTRRAVENTWLTASNVKASRVGSELKSLVRAPPGYTFVGADVDSQELWIASLLGDAQFGIHGGGALGYMTLVGSRKTQTDVHSRTASILGISRDEAKIFNYGRIYGAGIKFASTLLRQFLPELSDTQALTIAKRLYCQTKGRKSGGNLKKFYQSKSPFWWGGSESFVFNMLEKFASASTPRTPVLNAGITEALQAKNVGKSGFLTSRINWAIQSSGVDYLHLLIISMDWLCRRYNISARLSLTVHDEIRYLVLEKDKYRAAIALQVSNLWTRGLFSERVGIPDLPANVAFFGAIDIDKVLRKEVNMPCLTPSQRVPIPPGESLTISELLEKNAHYDLLYACPYSPEKAKGMEQDIQRLPEVKLPSITQEILLTREESRLEYVKAQIDERGDGDSSMNT